MKSYMTDKRIDGRLTDGNFVNKTYEVSQLELKEFDAPLIIDLQSVLEDEIYVVVRKPFELGHYMGVDVTITTILYSVLGVVKRCDPLGNGMYYVKLFVEEMPNGMIYELEEYMN